MGAQVGKMEECTASNGASPLVEQIIKNLSRSQKSHFKVPEKNDKKEQLEFNRSQQRALLTLPVLLR